LVHPLTPFAGDVALGSLRQRREGGAFRQLVRVLWQESAQGREIVLFAGHGVAQDHGGTISVQRPLGIAVILQRFARAGNGPFLRPIHGFGHAWWNCQILE